jgi:hypothetical protein
MPDYKQMLKEAEAREEAVKAVFKKYDHDGSGTIDDAEITCVMEDLGLLEGLQSQVTSFVAEMFGRYDDNNDGVLSFEVRQPGASRCSLCCRTTAPVCVLRAASQEFKKFYNAAKDDAQGRKPPPKPPAKLNRTSSSLSSDQEAARQKIKEEKARKKAEEAEKIRKENAAMKARMAVRTTTQTPLIKPFAVVWAEPRCVTCAGEGGKGRRRQGAGRGAGGGAQGGGGEAEG